MWIEFVSILPIIFLRLFIPKLLGRMVVAERSLMDFFVWLVITLRWSGVVRSLVGRSIISLQYLCDRIIYVRADLSTLLARRRGSKEEFLIPVQLRIYDAIAKAIEAPTIDTSKQTTDEGIREILRIAGAYE